MEKQIHNTITIPSYGATTIPIYITYRPRLPLEIHKLFQWTNYLPSKQQMIFFWKLARMWYKRGIYSRITQTESCVKYHQQMSGSANVPTP